MGFGYAQLSSSHDHVHDLFQSAPSLFHVPVEESCIFECPAHKDQLYTLDIPGGPQNIVGHNNLPDTDPIRCKTPDFWQDIYDGDLQYMFLLSVHFRSTVFLSETHIEYADHPCQEKGEKINILVFILFVKIVVNLVIVIQYYTIQTFVQRECHKSPEYPGQMPASNDRKPFDFPDWQSPPEEIKREQ